jgi:hypothetical protein
VLIALLGALLALVLPGGGGGACAALIAYEDLILRADGGFQPQQLPRRGYAPISFQGFVDIAKKGGGQPSPLRQAVVDFDRDGLLHVAGLPTCAPELIAQASTREARAACANAIVGTGRVEAAIAFPIGIAETSVPLTILNGPRLGGNPTVILHARTAIPSTETYAIEVPITRVGGYYRYRATLDIPPIASGLGAITRIEVDIGRRYRAGGKLRSYVSARCSNGILETHGRFSFEDGVIVDGAVEKPCTPK